MLLAPEQSFTDISPFVTASPPCVTPSVNKRPTSSCFMAEGSGFGDVNISSIAPNPSHLADCPSQFRLRITTSSHIHIPFVMLQRSIAGTRVLLAPSTKSILSQLILFAPGRTSLRTHPFHVGGSHPSRLIAKTSVALQTLFFIHIHYIACSMQIGVEPFITS